MKQLLTVAALLFSSFSVEATLSQESKGWQVEYFDDGSLIASHCQPNGMMQIIKIDAEGMAWYLVPGPYGYDCYKLNAHIPKNFPENYIGKSCWLRGTKSGSKLIMDHKAQRPEDLLRYCSVK